MASPSVRAHPLPRAAAAVLVMLVMLGTLFASRFKHPGHSQYHSGSGDSDAAACRQDRDQHVRSSHNFFLTWPEDVRRGQAFRGSAARLHEVAAKLLAGEAVHVAIVGGSTAWGQGALLGNNFGRRFFNWINATFPVAAPHLAQHRFTNAAKPAISSALYALCGNDMVPQDADLVILEFAFNDYHSGITMESPARAAFERLVRRMLAFPRAPAVVSMHFFSYWHAKPALGSPDPALAHRTGEDDLAVIAQYYDVPALSLRNAVLHHMYRNDPGFRVDLKEPGAALNLTDPSIPASRKNYTLLDPYFYLDDHHPWDRTGHWAMADLLVATMQDAVIEVQGGSVAAVAPIPQPMFPGNWEIANPTCKLGEAFKPTVVRSEGFEWRPRKPKAATFDGQKWAWIGEAEGAYVVLRLSTEVDRQGEAVLAAAKAGTPGTAEAAGAVARAAGAAGDGAAAGEGAAKGGAAAEELARVWLSHVCSWVDLGTASVACVSGCTCANATLDHFWHHERTLSDLMQLEVSQHPECEIQITVNKLGKRRKKKKLKLKGAAAAAAADQRAPATMLNAVMVTRTSGAALNGMGNVGQWDMMGR